MAKLAQLVGEAPEHFEKRAMLRKSAKARPGASRSIGYLMQAPEAEEFPAFVETIEDIQEAFLIAEAPVRRLPAVSQPTTGRAPWSDPNRPHQRLSLDEHGQLAEKPMQHLREKVPSSSPARDSNEPEYPD